MSVSLLQVPCIEGHRFEAVPLKFCPDISFDAYVTSGRCRSDYPGSVLWWNHRFGSYTVRTVAPQGTSVTEKFLSLLCWPPAVPRDAVGGLLVT